jgi:hypothetical protein
MGKLSELLLLVGGKSNTLISMQRSIDPENIGEITGALNVNYPK